MEYLNKILGIEVVYENVALTHLPNFIATRYRLQLVSMNGQRAIFLYPATELEQIEVLKKHIARIQKNENLPVILVLKELTYRQKESLLREKIPFIVDGRQIYLPFMAVYLQERCNAEKKSWEGILPSAQMLLLHFIYGGARELSTSQAANDLKLTPTSISRASKQLEKKWDCCKLKKGSTANSAIGGFPENAVQESRKQAAESDKANDLYSEEICRNRFIRKWVLGPGRVFYAERAERQMLCNRKNLPMERCYDK